MISNVRPKIYLIRNGRFVNTGQGNEGYILTTHRKGAYSLG